MSGEQEIARLVADWADAIRAGEIEGVVANHDADVVLYDVPPPQQLRGIDEYRRSFEGFLQWLGDDGLWELDDLAVFAGDDVAYAHCLVMCRGTGETETLPVRLTLGLRRRNGRWLIAHEHHSLPSG